MTIGRLLFDLVITARILALAIDAWGIPKMKPEYSDGELREAFERLRSDKFGKYHSMPASFEAAKSQSIPAALMRAEAQRYRMQARRECDNREAPWHPRINQQRPHGFDWKARAAGDSSLE